MSENERKEEAALGNLPVLEFACPSCEGFGGWREANGVWIKCPECEGKAFFPTEFGERVLDLVRRHKRHLLSE